MRFLEKEVKSLIWDRSGKGVRSTTRSVDRVHVLVQVNDLVQLNWLDDMFSLEK